MTKPEANLNNETRNAHHRRNHLGHSFFVIHSSFVIRHWSF